MSVEENCDWVNKEDFIASQERAFKEIQKKQTDESSTNLNTIQPEHAFILFVKALTQKVHLLDDYACRAGLALKIRNHDSDPLSAYFDFLEDGEIIACVGSFHHGFVFLCNYLRLKIALREHDEIEVSFSQVKSPHHSSSRYSLKRL